MEADQGTYRCLMETWDSALPHPKQQQQLPEPGDNCSWGIRGQGACPAARPPSGRWQVPSQLCCSLSTAVSLKRHLGAQKALVLFGPDSRVQEGSWRGSPHRWPPKPDLAPSTPEDLPLSGSWGSRSQVFTGLGAGKGLAHVQWLREGWGAAWVGEQKRLTSLLLGAP